MDSNERRDRMAQFSQKVALVTGGRSGIKAYPRGGHIFVVACRGRERVATGALILQGEGISEMVRISTRKTYGRRGIGQAIVPPLGNVARQRGDRRIIAKTNASWHDAIHLYKRLGFVEYGRTALGVG